MIECGILENHPRKIPFEILRLEMKDLPAIMALQEATSRRLHRKELLEKLSHEEMALHFGEKGFTIGAVADGALIGFCNAYLPGAEKHEWTLGYDIGLLDPVDLDRTANCQMLCVHPDFRGNSLGQRMLKHVVDIFRGYHRLIHLCATASPYNVWSIRILFAGGFSLRKLKLKYGGKLRYIAYRNLNRPLRFSENPLEIIRVRLTDIKRQETMMAQGFMGIGIRKIDGDGPRSATGDIEAFEVLFAKPLNWMAE